MKLLRYFGSGVQIITATSIRAMNEMDAISLYRNIYVRGSRFMLTFEYIIVLINIVL